MKITDIKIFNNNDIRTGILLKVGDFTLNNKKLTFTRDSDLTTSEYQSSFGRVYILSINGEIYKIGGSADKAGIKGTIGGYLGGKSGSPGESRFALNTLITRELIKKEQVVMHMIICPESYVRINGLISENKMVAVFAFKEIEKQCLEDYKSFNTGKVPEWNFKEGGKSYPQDIREDYARYKKENAKKTLSKTI